MVLQIDAPDLAMERNRFFSHLGEAEFLRQLELHVAAINLGIEGIPRERIRLHVCWGNSDAPHVHDIAMTAILPELYRANVGALSIEFANPRHQHEYDALRSNPLPAHHAADARRSRLNHEFCRASGACRSAARGGCVCGR